MIIKTLKEMTELMQLRRNYSASYVLCHGVFDIVHIGHIKHLEWAKKQGDILMASITPDHQVNKGPGRPRFKQERRAQVIDALNCVDYTIVGEDLTAEKVIAELQPNFYVKGHDIKETPTAAFYVEAEAVDKYGGKVLFSPPDPMFHSTEIIKFMKPEDIVTTE